VEKEARNGPSYKQISGSSASSFLAKKSKTRLLNFFLTHFFGSFNEKVIARNFCWQAFYD